MTLQTPQPPADARRAVVAALRCEDALSQPAAAVLRHSPGPLLPTHPLAVYVLEGVTGRLASARHTGWRFLITQGATEVAAAAEVVETPDGHAFSHFTAGPYLDSTLRALRQAWQLTEGAHARHQPRLLSLPGHYATALWLHSPSAGEDLLIPLTPAPLGVTAHRVYPAAELLATLEHSPVAAPALLGRG
jgi:hypothetical protein